MERGEFDILLMQHYDALQSWCMFLARDEDAAQDLAHDVIIKAIEASDSFINVNMREWLFSIAKNCFINNIKKCLKTPCDELDDDTFNSGNISPAMDIEEEWGATLYQEAVESLSQRLRETFQLRESGLSVIETAQKLNIPRGTVKSRTHMATRAIRIFIEKAMNLRR